MQNTCRACFTGAGVECTADGAFRMAGNEAFASLTGYWVDSFTIGGHGPCRAIRNFTAWKIFEYAGTWHTLFSFTCPSPCFMQGTHNSSKDVTQYKCKYMIGLFVHSIRRNPRSNTHGSHWSAHLRRNKWNLPHNDRCKLSLSSTGGQDSPHERHSDGWLQQEWEL
jgi:hypothetical protein